MKTLVWIFTLRFLNLCCDPWFHSTISQLSPTIIFFTLRSFCILWVYYVICLSWSTNFLLRATIFEFALWLWDGRLVCTTIVALVIRSSDFVLCWFRLSYDHLILDYDRSVCSTIVWFWATIVLSVCLPTFLLYYTIHFFTSRTFSCSNFSVCLQNR